MLFIVPGSVGPILLRPCSAETSAPQFKVHERCSSRPLLHIDGLHALTWQGIGLGRQSDMLRLPT